MAVTILIADDDAVARLVENMVQKCGYENVSHGNCALSGGRNATRV
jgi:hypothetical protein